MIFRTLNRYNIYKTDVFIYSTKPTLSRKQKKSLLEVRDYVQNTVKSKKVLFCCIKM